MRQVSLKMHLGFFALGRGRKRHHAEYARARPNARSCGARKGPTQEHPRRQSQRRRAFFNPQVALVTLKPARGELNKARDLGYKRGGHLRPPGALLRLMTDAYCGGLPSTM